MKPPHLILVLLISAFALGDIASLCYVQATHQFWPDLPGVILLSLVFSQQALAAVWFTFARGNIAVRLLIALGVEFGLTLVAAGATGAAQKIGPWFAIELLAFCSFVLPLGTAKLLRWRIRLADQANAAARLPSWQFSIWGLLSWTTAVAIAVGTARQVDMPLLAVAEASAFFGCIAANGLLVLAVSMGIRLPAVAATVTLLVVVMICPLAGMLIGRTGMPPQEHPMVWAIFGLCNGAAVAVSVLVLRVAGYRLDRDSCATTSGETTATIFVPTKATGASSTKVRK